MKNIFEKLALVLSPSLFVGCIIFAMPPLFYYFDKWSAMWHEPQACVKEAK